MWQDAAADYDAGDRNGSPPEHADCAAAGGGRSGLRHVSEEEQGVSSARNSLSVTGMLKAGTNTTIQATAVIQKMQPSKKYS